ncbi:hypothetical protein AB1L30_13885 [Bremerella sp. JC817]|uniref:hypothetical protein n=1 Tax=Bremerella sp. JC817 TaxID=3231756 RepID=UPI00345A76D2
MQWDDPESLIYAALYCDDEGDVIGLDEVQLLDAPSETRVEILLKTLSHEDWEARKQAARVLAAWGFDAGLDTLEQLIDLRIDQHGVEVRHSIYGYNYVFDQLAEAVHLFQMLGESPRREEDQRRIYSKLLALYGECDFRSDLKYALARSGYAELLPEVVAAIERALAADKVYQASQLLPVVARWSPAIAWDWTAKFWSEERLVPSPLANVAEALGEIDTDASREMLQSLSTHVDTVVRDEAAHSWEKLHRPKPE